MSAFDEIKQGLQEAIGMPPEIMARPMSEDHNHGSWNLDGAKKHPEQPRAIAYTRKDLTQTSIDRGRIEELEEENRFLKDQVEHLKACKEFESNLQMEILEIGARYINKRRGQTINTNEAWKAIQENLKEQCTYEIKEK